MEHLTSDEMKKITAKGYFDCLEQPHKDLIEDVFWKVVNEANGGKVPFDKASTTRRSDNFKWNLERPGAKPIFTIEPMSDEEMFKP